MKAKQMLNGLKAVTFIIIMIFVGCTSCKKGSDPIPTPPAPIPKLAVVIIDTIENVTRTTATVFGSLTPNEAGTTVSIEYTGPNGILVNVPIPIVLKTDSLKSKIKFNYVFSGLKKGTVYTFKIKATNKAGIFNRDSLIETYAVADADSNLYHTVTIGTQTSLKENFRGTHYANGDPITKVSDPTEAENIKEGAYAIYNNDQNIGNTYGYLYNFAVGVDPRGLIPGWHVPTVYEYVDLQNFLGGWYWMAGPALMEAGTSHWKRPDRLYAQYYGTNSTGFTALPNGAFANDPITGKFVFMNLHESFIVWTSSTVGSSADAVEISCINNWLFIGGFYKQKLYFGLRLFKN